MASKVVLDKVKLLKKLESVDYEKGEEKAESTFLERMNLAGSLLALAEVDQEHEHGLCLTIAQHLLAKVPEPDDIPLEEEYKG